MSEAAASLAPNDDSFDISIGEENDGIFATCLKPSAHTLDTDILRQIIYRHGYSAAYFDEELMQSVVDAHNQTQEKFHLKIGERRDAYCKVLVTPDQQKAFLSTNLAYGGRELCRADIFKAMVAAGVCRGIINQCISYALEKGRVDRILIARGVKPINGKDSEFKPLIVKYRDRRPLIDESGRAHYQEIGNLVTVSTGDAIMRRLPPSKGIDGFDVLGNCLKARDGQDIPYSSELTGVSIDPDDPDVLRASVNGQPLILNHGAIVEKTIHLEEVDLNSGNIDFDGSISISGKVATGMSVFASGDIIIGGMVEAAATVRAGGDIDVQQGIIGRGAVADDKGETGKGIAVIEAGGNVSARFIEHAKVNAGQSVLVDELLAHSEVSAASEVVAGNKKSKNGHIRGGSVSAGIRISAQVLGSPAGVATHLKCGDLEVHNNALEQAQVAMEECRQRRRLLEQNLARQCVAATTSHNKHVSKDIIQRTQSQLDDVNAEITKLHVETTSLKQQLEDCFSRQIHCQKKAYPNIDIAIADASIRLAEEKSFGRFYYEDRQILFTSAK